MTTPQIERNYYGHEVLPSTRAHASLSHAWVAPRESRKYDLKSTLHRLLGVVRAIYSAAAAEISNFLVTDPARRRDARDACLCCVFGWSYAPRSSVTQ